jgi:hypothetical protein
MSEDPSDLGVDLYNAQLYGEGMVGTTWLRLHPYGHSLLTKRFDLAAKKGQKEGRARQPSSQQLLDDLTYGL